VKSHNLTPRYVFWSLIHTYTQFIFFYYSYVIHMHNFVHVYTFIYGSCCTTRHSKVICNTLQHHVFQHTAAHCNTVCRSTLEHIDKHCNTVCCNTLQRTATHCGHAAQVATQVVLFTSFLRTGWRRLKLQVIFRKRATIYRALLRKMTNARKASYDSTPPPCIYLPSTRE